MPKVANINKMMAFVLMLFHFGYSSVAIAMDAKFEAHIGEVGTTGKTLTKEKKFACPKCPRWFTGQYYLITHVEDCGKSLDEKRKFGCPRCQKKFTQRSNLTTHAVDCGKSLDEKRKFICTKCRRGFTQKGNLTTHAAGCGKSLGERRKFICSKCQRGFTGQSYLTMHAADCGKSLGERRKFICSRCKKKFASKQSLGKHKCSKDTLEEDLETVSESDNDEEFTRPQPAVTGKRKGQKSRQNRYALESPQQKNQSKVRKTGEKSKVKQEPMDFASNLISSLSNDGPLTLDQDEDSEEEIDWDEEVTFTRATIKTTLGTTVVWDHRTVEEKVEVFEHELLPKETDGTSQKGVRAVSEIKAGNVIAEYRGKLLTPEELKTKFPDDSLTDIRQRYIANVDHYLPSGEQKTVGYIDAFREQPDEICLAARVNHADPENANAELVVASDSKTLLLVASKDIHPGEEVLLDYGVDYWSPNKKTKKQKTIEIVQLTSRSHLELKSKNLIAPSVVDRCENLVALPIALGVPMLEDLPPLFPGIFFY